MRRILPLLAVLALPASLLAADPDVVTVRLNGKEVEKRGALEKETPDSVTLKTGGTAAEFPTKDVVSLTHGDATPEYRQAEDAEQGADYARAAELYAKASASKARPWIAHDSLYHRADCLYHIGNLKDAAAALKDLSEKAPEGRFKSLAQVRLGQCHLFLKALPESEAAFKALRSSRRNWEDAAGIYWLGRVSEAKGDLAAAQKAYEDAGTAAFADIKAMAKARLVACTVQEKASRDLLDKNKPGNLLSLADETSTDKPSYAAVQNAIGQVCLALAKTAKDKEEVSGLAFDGAMAFCKVLVFSEAYPEEQALAYGGAIQCYGLLKDETGKAAQLREDLKEFHDAFPTIR